MADRYRSIVDVHVILERGDEILLLERQGTGYCDGMLHLPSGHLDEGEPLPNGAAREAREEVGVDIDPGDLVLAAVVHHRQRPDLARVGFFFATTRWAGEPRNAEPHKCSKLQWCDPRVLPSNTIDYPAAGIDAYLAGVPFTAHGWDHYSAGRSAGRDRPVLPALPPIQTPQPPDRQLMAYVRCFTRPRPYPLRDPGQASDMSASW